MEKRHIFLTGEVQVGKSTLLAKLLSQPGVPVPVGFRTVSVPDLPDGRMSVYLLPVQGVVSVGARSRVGMRRGVHESFPAVFDTAGVASLRGAERAALILMDEVGRMERDASCFTARILELLDGETPIIGVLKKRCDTPLCEAIRVHPAVELITVTPENRESLFPALLTQLRQNLHER